jgi:hypothetical protein
MREDERDRVVRQGLEAWRRLKKEKSYGDWIKVGEALRVGREWAMNQAGTNEPRGKGYNMAFGEWLTNNKFDDMDKGDRSRLFELMDNLGPIEDYRRTLSLTQRLKLNHPNAVVRNWKKAVEPEPEPGSEPAKPTLREENIQLSWEGYVKDKRIAELQAHNTELKEEIEAGRTRDVGNARLLDGAFKALRECFMQLGFEGDEDARIEKMLSANLFELWQDWVRCFFADPEPVDQSTPEPDTALHYDEHQEGGTQ